MMLMDWDLPLMLFCESQSSPTQSNKNNELPITKLQLPEQNACVCQAEQVSSSYKCAKNALYHEERQQKLILQKIMK